MKDIEIVQWVKFNKPGIIKEIKELAKSSNSKMDFLRAVRDKYKLTLADADVVANNFYQKN